MWSGTLFIGAGVAPRDVEFIARAVTKVIANLQGDFNSISKEVDAI